MVSNFYARMFIRFMIRNQNYILELTSQMDQFERQRTKKILFFRLYHACDGHITINLNATVCGDFSVTIYHARNALKGMGRPQGIKVCQFQMHSGFIPEEETLIRFDKCDLDELPDAEHIPSNFSISLPISVGPNERSPSTKPSWTTSSKSKRNPIALFSSQLEYEENVDNFSKKIGIYNFSLYSFIEIFFSFV